MAPPDALTDSQLANIQGDIWRKGFPKDFETYYFFSIEMTQAKTFAENLKKLADHPTPLISSLKDVRGDRKDIQTFKKQLKAAQAEKGVDAVGEPGSGPKKPVVNALIAFTMKGLEVIQSGLKNKRSLWLTRVANNDKAFGKGMAHEDVRAELNDPYQHSWDPLFKAEIHGLLKVAGNSQQKVEGRLKEIQEVLGHGTVIKDVPGNSPPTTIESRVDGWTRPDRGKEHFGFEDGISQPRMKGIDDLEPDPDADAYAVVNMNTAPHIIIVTKDTHSEAAKNDRPEWMYDGSFLVFRKLEQDVEGFQKLTSQWDHYNCESQEHMGAKLMGRQKNGEPIAKRKPQVNSSKVIDPVEAKNNFGFGPTEESCPVSAHIRKTNLRELLTNDGNQGDTRAPRTRIIRSGIAYGNDYKENSTDKSTRGLLFACYQSHIEDGFQHMQGAWSNKTEFRKPGAGHDPIIGQVDQWQPGVNGELTTHFTDKTDNPEKKQTITFKQLVTLRGGDYFFVPPISALRGALASV